MLRRPWPNLLPAVAVLAVLAGLVACSDDDDAPTDAPAGATTVAPATVASVVASVAPVTAPPATPAPTTTPPVLTTPTSVFTDTAAVGSSTLSTVDLATGAATATVAVGTEVGVLGIALRADGAIDAVTDVPTLLVVDRAAPGEPGAATPLDAGGDTLLALARRPADGALFAIGDSGAIVRIDPTTGAATPVAKVGLDDPGVGLDVAADGNLEVVVATRARYSVDVARGVVTDLPATSADEAPLRIVAIAHDVNGRYGIDADHDELVTIADDGTVDTIGPLGLDVTDGASLDIGADGVAVLANPG